MTLQDIMKMLGSSPTSAEMSRMGQMVNPVSTGAQLTEAEMARMAGLGQPTNMEMARMAASFPANEMMPNYADGQMPLYMGGLLQNPQGNMIDPQQLMNTAYNMDAPREMRIDAINRLRQLGAI